MKDTPEYINQIQQDIFFAMPVQERFKQGIYMAIDGKKILEYSIKSSLPGISNLDLKIEVFKRMYGKEFTEDQLQNIFLFFKKHTE